MMIKSILFGTSQIAVNNSCSWSLRRRMKEDDSTDIEDCIDLYLSYLQVRNIYQTVGRLSQEAL